MKRERKSRPVSAARRVLMVAARVDVDATQGRYLWLVRRLAEAGYAVDVMTHAEEVEQRAREQLNSVANVKVIRNKAKQVYWPPHRRDDIVKTFIKQNSDLIVPGTDLPYWKTAAYDDFRGHVSSYTFDPLDPDYDLVMASFPSVDEPPAMEADVLLSTALFHAREHGIPLAGIQIYPARQCPRNYQRLFDHLIVRNEDERNYYVHSGIAPESLWVLSDPRDNYAVTTIEDTYRNFMYDESLPSRKEELGIVIVNNARFRAQVIQAITAIGECPFAKTLCFVKLKYEIREISEDQIFDELVKPHLDALGREYYIADITSVPKLAMVFDVMIATTFIAPLTFARNYGKGAVVFNPLRVHAGEEQGVSLLSRTRDLKEYLTTLYASKQRTTGIVDAVRGILQ